MVRAESRWRAKGLKNVRCQRLCTNLQANRKRYLGTFGRYPSIPSGMATKSLAENRIDSVLMLMTRQETQKTMRQVQARAASRSEIIPQHPNLVYFGFVWSYANTLHYSSTAPWSSLQVPAIASSESYDMHSPYKIDFPLPPHLLLTIADDQAISLWRHLPRLAVA